MHHSNFIAKANHTLGSLCGRAHIHGHLVLPQTKLFPYSHHQTLTWLWKQTFRTRLLPPIQIRTRAGSNRWIGLNVETKLNVEMSLSYKIHFDNMFKFLHSWCSYSTCIIYYAKLRKQVQFQHLLPQPGQNVVSIYTRVCLILMI